MVKLFETKIITKVAGALFIALLFGAVFISVKAQTVDQLNQQKTDIQKKLAEINAQIQKHQQAIATAKKAENTLKNEISIYNNQIASTELEIQADNTRIDDTNLQIRELQLQIEKRIKEIADNKNVLAQLIIQLNQLQSESSLNVGLGSKNFSSFLDQVQYTESVQGKVMQIIQNIKTIKAKLTSQQESLKVQLAKLQELKDQLLITQSSLQSQSQAKQKLLTQTKGQEASYQKLLATSKNQEADLQKEIDDLDNSIRAKLGKLSINPSKGVLAYPMDGIMTQGYGNTGFTKLGYTFHNGIDLAAPAGKPIYAAADGVVTNCDTGEAAYGNWCAIKHNITTKSGSRQIVTLYAHMRSFKVHAGQNVKQGDLVGYEGNTGNTTRLIYGPERGYHLHFTVFDAQGFGVSPGAYTKIYGSYSVPFGYTYNPLDFLGK
jgi:murein DD-endopeptidase MepM/ murein hydrolase activator NlpD